jgi:hypothetical protein
MAYNELNQQEMKEGVLCLLIDFLIAINLPITNKNGSLNRNKFLMKSDTTLK